MKAAIALLFVSLLALSGCAQLPRDHTVKAGPLPYADLDELLHLYPDRFAMYHHVILTVRGKNYDFTGYLAFEGDHISALGFNDLGGRLFHIISSTQKTDVLSKPAHMPATVLRSGVMPELEALFVVPQVNRLFAGTSGETMMLRDGVRDIDYLFASDGHRCQTIVLSEGATRISFIQILDYRSFEGWNGEIPQTYQVSNRKWNYEMTLRLLQIKPS
jgi:hypothetical protein